MSGYAGKEFYRIFILIFAKKNIKMCLIVFALNQHKDYKLIFAANRDEFYNRPSSPAKFWDDYPNLLAGKDLKEGGTWMGITKEGDICCNYKLP